MEKLIKEAFIAGYEQGHNDTVESGYGCSPDKADEYYLDISNQVQAVVKVNFAEVNKIINESMEAARLEMDASEHPSVYSYFEGQISALETLQHKLSKISA